MATSLDDLARQFGGSAVEAPQPAASETRVAPSTQQTRDAEAFGILAREQGEIQSRIDAAAQAAQAAQAADAAAQKAARERLERAQADLRQLQREMRLVGTRAGIVETAAEPMAQPAPRQRAAMPGEIPRAVGVAAPPSVPQPSPSLVSRLLGELEAAGVLVSGATTAPLSAANAAVGEFLRQLMGGQLGTEAGNVAGERAIQSGMAAGTYAPRTELGREYAQRLTGALQQVPPYIPVVGQAAVPAVAGTQQMAAEVRTGAREAMTAPRVAPPAAVERIEPTMDGSAAAPAVITPTASQVPVLLEPGAPQAAPTTGAVARGSAGAAGVAPEVQRRATAAAMPVPFAGPAGLTKGQATRDFAQLQFEKETAKLPDVGEPLRERVQAQTANFIRNFDALIDLPQPVARESGDIGRVVTDAVANKAEVKRREIRAAYAEAERRGQMREPVDMAPLATGLNNMSSMEGVVPMISAARREAVRLGALTPDAQGNLQPGRMTVKDAETLRQFVNKATDWGDERESRFARQINSLIDQSTEGKGGELYKNARRLRREFADEFENVGLTARLIGTKRGTTERQIALEDVFDKVIVLSPVEEMNKVRSTLLKAGPAGQQAWSDLKAAGIDYIKSRAFSASQQDAAGNPLLSPDRLQRAVASMDRSGKLEALYGKKQAQVLRDLGELSTVIYTAPPGAINTSNTASALRVALDSLVMFGATGIPAPVITSLQQASKYMKNREIRKRVEEALSEPR